MASHRATAPRASGAARARRLPSGRLVPGRIWGNEIYTDDSSICTAAVHAGLITVERGGSVAIAIHGPGDAFEGGTRNGVTSEVYGAFPGSFIVIDGQGESFMPAGFTPIAWNANVVSHRGEIGTVLPLVLRAMRSEVSGLVWGAGPIAGRLVDLRSGASRRQDFAGRRRPREGRDSFRRALVPTFQLRGRDDRGVRPMARELRVSLAQRYDRATEHGWQRL